MTRRNGRGYAAFLAVRWPASNLGRVRESKVEGAPVMEFWPDYGPGPLWVGGRAEAPESLGLEPALASALERWNEEYDEALMPVEGTGDSGYIATGVALLARVRQALAGRFRVVVTEPWWGEEPSDGERG